MGVDPGSATTGFGVVDLVEGRLRHVANGRISPGHGPALADRLKVIHDELSALLRDVRPDAVAVESLFFARNVKSALVLAHSRGIVLLAAAEAGLPVAEYSPMEVKRATVGYGRAGKEQVQAMVARLLALQEAPGPDAADALGVAICHAHHWSGPLARLASSPRPSGGPVRGSAKPSRSRPPREGSAPASLPIRGRP